ncbi:hypothetical protein DAPPUDRAFT_316776 [Daphnia pulex]|uniref:Uncharacterized protein n=1 Tax=Daphnia pulex TaxID=6669 RepID=E9GDZ3_DAPPU|nr:hypothetical protein DAPPUDRAFT_316776 [Daphnia pulex]|eukprot:EFX82175.1 hypothetical protein DAPPUDRAFT_316776 [Daphnia pulex]
MTKIPLIAVFSVWLFVVYGQIPVNNFDPYHAYYNPYTSTFTNQPIRHVNDGTAAQQSGETGEFKNNPSIRDLFYQGAIFLRIKQLEATTASLARQLKGIEEIMLI